MNDEMSKTEKTRERLGIFLVCAIMVVSGLLLLKGEEGSEIEYVESQNSIVSQLEGEVKSASKEMTAEKPTYKSRININTATISDLDTLPGIGEVTAQKIIDHRKINGPFKSIEEIMDVKGIGEAKFEKMKSLITI